MSKRFWVADLHLGHANICVYCKRPWFKQRMIVDNPASNRGWDWVSDAAKDECAAAQNKGLIGNMNGRIKEDDLVVHVGDFCCYGNERGVSGSRTKAQEWLAQLNGEWFMIEGNHDHNNSLRKFFQSCVVEIGGMTAWVQHRPVESRVEIPDFCDFVICGHVHDKWQTQWIGGMLNINVGVDARKYLPMNDMEVIGIAQKELGQ